MNRRFPGVFIPSEIWLNTDFSWAEKMYLAEIDSLDSDEKGCYAGNKHLGEFFNQSAQKAAAVIKQLENRKAIHISYDGNSKRHIRVIHPAYRGEIHENGMLEVIQSSEVKESQEKKDLRNIARQYFFQLYHFKARELTGRVGREDGKPFHPQWSGKEGRLLKMDFEQHGLSELKRMMLLFFSDKVSEVADFTRYKEKAGYAYTVFHGSIPKLIMSKKNPVEPCMECGKYSGHYPECSQYEEIIKQRAEEEQEIEQERVQLGEVSLMDMVRKKKRNTNQDSYLEGEDEKAE